MPECTRNIHHLIETIYDTNEIVNVLSIHRAHGEFRLFVIFTVIIALSGGISSSFVSLLQREITESPLYAPEVTCELLCNYSGCGNCILMVLPHIRPSKTEPNETISMEMMLKLFYFCMQLQLLHAELFTFLNGTEMQTVVNNHCKNNANFRWNKSVSCGYA